MNISRIIVGEYQRGSKKDFKEHQLIEKYSANGNKLMINVGAHFGGSLSGFLTKGWKVIAFEPDKKNRAVLEKNYYKEKNLEIIPEAVSDYIEEKSPFYTSAQSSGISTLSPFDDSHSLADYVNTTTLEKFCEDRDISEIEFLMIDAEGFDLQILRGFPWGKISPEFIVCEFEDKKTTKLDYSFNDLADYLQDRGYTLLVYEWHPIEQYGIQHDWRCLKHYPCSLEDENGWGNIIAFREEPDWSMIYTIARAISVPVAAQGYSNKLKKILGKIWKPSASSRGIKK